MKISENSAAGHRKRLRDRFMKSSLAGFHDYEAIELLLTYAVPRRDVKPLAKELLRRFKSIRGVFDASYEDLSAVTGIGGHSAMLIMLVKGAVFAYLSERTTSKKPISSAEDVVDYMNASQPDNGTERFYALYLNSKNEVIDSEVLYPDGVGAIQIQPRPVIDSAFRHNARAIIFVHRKAVINKTIPKRDEALLRSIESAARAVDILIHDYIVMTTKTHESGLLNGWLRGPRGR